MSERPLSDRRPHEPTDLCWEVRAWAPPPGRRPDVEGWRSLGWSATHDDAVALARGVTASREYEYAEVWGPAEMPAPGRTRQCERFPEPDADERRALWLRAAAEHYTDGIDLPHRTFADTV
ncbi:hypothetical protein [Actinomycetospora cinnamomea]|uniref:Uncharacterized protein n=1 Tax=Actinomycetospora cinnamomea TaxID=663609 RepID=A0A2U1F109_9PSEU|nr:hypothetical protein [Actinomycetospora cinnamomea]PVZ05877.1 hypothetical protein C8D89_114133 [Actinomycetospora cinnamomea]